MLRQNKTRIMKMYCESVSLLLYEPGVCLLHQQTPRRLGEPRLKSTGPVWSTITHVSRIGSRRSSVEIPTLESQSWPSVASRHQRRTHGRHHLPFERHAEMQPAVRGCGFEWGWRPCWHHRCKLDWIFVRVAQSSRYCYSCRSNSMTSTGSYFLNIKTTSTRSRKQCWNVRMDSTFCVTGLGSSHFTQKWVRGHMNMRHLSMWVKFRVRV